MNNVVYGVSMIACDSAASDDSHSDVNLLQKKQKQIKHTRQAVTVGKRQGGKVCGKQLDLSGADKSSLENLETKREIQIYIQRCHQKTYTGTLSLVLQTGE